ncbi:hypothetical protein ACLOJK_008980 [Asimina triloba]
MSSSPLDESMTMAHHQAPMSTLHADSEATESSFDQLPVSSTTTEMPSLKGDVKVTVTEEPVAENRKKPTNCC